MAAHSSQAVRFYKGTAVILVSREFFPKVCVLKTWSPTRVAIMGSGGTFSVRGVMEGRQITGVLAVGGYWSPSLSLLFFPSSIGEQPALPCTPPCSMLQV